MITFPVTVEVVSKGEKDIFGSFEQVVRDTFVLDATSSVVVTSAERSGNTISERQVVRLYVTADLDDTVTVGDRFILNGKRYEISDVVNFPATWFTKPSWFGSYMDGVAIVEVFDED